MEHHDKDRPTTNRAASNVNHSDPPIVSDAVDLLADLDALAEHLRGKFVVQTETDDEKFRTHVYLTAKAAENAVRRGNARGKRVHVALCQLLPVGVVVGIGGGR